MLKVGVPHVTAQRETHTAALALCVHQPCLLQFAEMMRDGGRTDAGLCVEVTTKKIVGCGNLLQDREAPRVRQTTRDGLELIQVESSFRSVQAGRHTKY